MAAEPEGGVLVEKGPPKEPRKKTKYDVIIIGAGPAGYTAGIYCSRARRDTLILSGILPGGQLVNTTDVENFPGFENGIMGPDLMINFRKQAERMGTTIVDDEVVNVDFRHRPFKVLTSEEEYEAKAVIVGTGATPRKLGVEGEKAFAGKGVSYCATCDGPFFKNMELVVVGGGDSAMEEATFLTKFATTVHVVHRRKELRASKIMQERAHDDEKIRFHLGYEVKEIRGNGKVQQVVLASPDGEEQMDTGGVFVAIGHDPNTELFKGQLETDDQGYIVLKGASQTSVPGVFAAGDVHDRRYRQAITAAGFGCMAGIDVNNYLDE
ncbi:thioredoxin reductase [Cenarchaeum symbiosum A]|uniref:Thioredoxin reductase n=1 Tax=Cenarchaeum symbiosum (strain A) TaxID=414004 RepID=A0RUI2_CENSY|nr:thioredoxin reductase [Cenarchaeum symbiosum A]